MREHLEERVDTSTVNLMLTDCSFENLSTEKPNVVWQQCSYDQPTVRNTREQRFQDRVSLFVYVSYWQYERFRVLYGTPQEKSIVIKNAVVPVEKHEKPTGNIKLIYTSTPFRGLDVLLDAFENLGRDDVELDIYSSTVIYGSAFHEQNKARYEPLFDRALSMKNVNYIGYATNGVVKDALTRAHIFAYPNTWEETSCIAAIEALSAGCRVVTTDNGALPETCGDFARYVRYGDDYGQLVSDYTEVLNEEIDTFWDKRDELCKQVEHMERYYSWDRRATEWERALGKL